MFFYISARDLVEAEMDGARSGLGMKESPEIRRGGNALNKRADGTLHSEPRVSFMAFTVMERSSGRSIVG